MSASFLKGYFATAGAAPFLPRSRDQLRVLIDAYLLEKAVYELSYELNNRPDWVLSPCEVFASCWRGKVHVAPRYAARASLLQLPGSETRKHSAPL